MIKNYNQLTIKQFLQCKIIAELEQDPIDRKIKMLSIVTGKSEDSIEEMKIEDLMASLKEFSEVESLHPESKVRFKFKIGKQRFELIWKTQELLASQYIDATHFTKDSESVVGNIHNILAAICLKKTWYGKRIKYDGAKHKEISDLFYNELKISTAYPILLFFCKFCEMLEVNIQTCLMEEIQKVRTLLVANGDGLQP